MVASDHHCAGEDFGRFGRSSLLILGLLCVGFVVIGVVVAGSWWLFWPKYTATATLRIAAVEPSFIPSNAKSYSREEFEIYKDTQAQYIQNRLVLWNAYRREVKVEGEKIKIANLPVIAEHNDDPVKWLTDRISVTFPGKAEIMQVSIATDNPKQSAAIVNAVVEAYMSEVVETERRRKMDRICEVEKICSDKEAEVRKLRNDLKQTAMRYNVAESETVDIRQKIALDELSVLHAELLRREFEVIRMRGELASEQAVLQAVENTPISDMECDMAATWDPILRQVSLEIVDAESAKQATALRKAKAADDGQDDVNRLHKNYSARMEQIREEIRNKKRSEVEKEIKRLEAVIAVAAKQQLVTEEDATRLRKKVEQFGNVSIDVEMLRTALQNCEKTLGSLAAERDRLRVELNSPPRISLLQKADVPAVPGVPH